MRRRMSRESRKNGPLLLLQGTPSPSTVHDRAKLKNQPALLIVAAFHDDTLYLAKITSPKSDLRLPCVPILDMYSTVIQEYTYSPVVVKGAHSRLMEHRPPFPSSRRLRTA